MTLDRDMARVFLLRKQAKALEAEAAEILERYTFEEDTAFSAGGFIVRVNRTRRFDPALAKKVLHPDDYSRILVTKPDSGQSRSCRRMTTEQASASTAGPSR